MRQVEIVRGFTKYAAGSVLPCLAKRVSIVILTCTVCKTLCAKTVELVAVIFCMELKLVD